MPHDHTENNSEGMTRRDALLAAGANGLAMMGCSACEAGEVKMTSGAGTLPQEHLEGGAEQPSQSAHANRGPADIPPAHRNTLGLYEKTA